MGENGEEGLFADDDKSFCDKALFRVAWLFSAINHQTSIDNPGEKTCHGEEPDRL
jgi:hypothetical protein